jgi:hypothetical protein
MNKEQREQWLPWFYVVLAPIAFIVGCYFFGPAVYEFLWATGIL